MKANGKEKIVVIGGGISGLSAGIYALLAGFDVTIYEKNAIPGGECIVRLFDNRVAHASLADHQDGILIHGQRTQKRSLFTCQHG